MWYDAGILRAWRFRADDGLVTDLGGGCGAGGRAGITCGRAGNTAFSHQLVGARANVPAYLLLATSRADLPCGPCRLVPDPLQSFVVAAGNTDANGDASVTTPIPFAPSLIGLRFIDQWLVAQVGGCAAVNAAFSNAIAVQIQ